MPGFWAFWIPANLSFWIYIAATVEKPNRVHFGVSMVMFLVTGILPLVIFKVLSD